ncbi:sodium/bile acid cotransporter [Gouania willdenowi]|uniref:Hepatic sodium/bile acid cotransporter n=1 Tax=Gouania willdenowi TaxID=441366 RepID=A0A8C5I1X3_GOUWI|nr:sodium/bile acid cotransporter-like [Gouania willdenowi]
MESIIYPTADLSLEPNSSLWLNVTALNSTALYSPLSPIVDKFVSIFLIIALSLTMVSMGCTMELSKIKQNILKPKGVAIAMVAQYGVMPLTAFGLSKVLQLSDMAALSVLICGCCPGGALSNVQALLIEGDMNLSIVMTSFSTVAALGMMPLLLYLYCQGFDSIHKFVPFVDIILSLILILVPCAIGIIINHFRPKYSNIFRKVGVATLLTAVVVVATVVTIDIGGSMLELLAPSLLAICAIMPFIGYAFGFIIASIFRLNPSQRRTVSMETGCQNTQLASTILKVAFPPTTIGPLFMFPMIYALSQLTEALVLVVFFKCYKRITKKQKGNCQEQSVDEKLQEPMMASSTA